MKSNTFTPGELAQMTAVSIERLGKLRAGLATAEKQGEDGQVALGLAHAVDRFQALCMTFGAALRSPAPAPVTFTLDDLERALETVQPLHRANMRKQDRTFSALLTKLTAMTPWPVMAHDEY